VDVALPTYNVDVSKLESARSARTKAVMIAHTLGNPFDLDAVTDFCGRHGLWLIEDNCDANGSLYRSRRTGTFGDISTLSFYPPHHMTMGEGGAVLCKTPRMASIVRSYRDWGRDCWCDPGKDNTCGKRFAWQLGELPLGYDHKYVYSHLGYNLKATDLQAAIGLAQLGKIEAFGAARRANWGYYRQELDGLSEHFVLPEATTGADASWFGFLLCVRESAPFTRRDVVCELESKNIQTRMLFAGNLVRQPALTTLVQQCREEGRPMPYRVVGGLAETDKVMEQAFWFGVYPGLTEAMREFVVATVKSFAARVRR
jgi:CDP-6-deoxy-D-xylo-4-hexulose-3-dehydrase